MILTDLIPKAPDILRQGPGHGHGPVVAAGAAHRDDENGLPFLGVKGQGIGEQVFQALHVPLRLGEGENVVIDLGVHAGLSAQGVHVVGIRQEADVQHQIGLQREAIFIAEGADADAHAALLSLGVEDAQELAPELRRGEIRGVDDPIRLPPDGLHEPPLPADGLLQRAAVSLQGMETAGLLVAVDDSLRRGFQEKEAAGDLHGPELRQHVGEFRLGLGRPHIINQGHPVIAASHAAGAELRELQHHPRRHVIHDIKAHILQIGGGFALSRTGKA